LSGALSPQDPHRPLESEASHAPQHRGGPYLLVIPLALTIATLWWVRRPADSGVPTGPPARVDPDSTHDVLGGEAVLSGATLAFWLAPSDPVSDRQAFQAQALRKRYALPEGEPWRLRLEWRRPADRQIAAAEAPGLDVSRLAVVDGDGVALAPLMLARELDPLATLLAPPAQPLTIGTSLDLFLWGREPRAGARLSGLAGDSHGSASLEVNLTSRPLRMGDLVGPMARLEPPAAGANAATQGKRTGTGASALPARGTDDARY
jgi:hypothetical protein